MNSKGHLAVIRSCRSLQLSGIAATSAGAAALTARQKRSSLRAEHYAGILLVRLDTFLRIATTLQIKWLKMLRIDEKIQSKEIVRHKKHSKDNFVLEVRKLLATHFCIKEVVPKVT